MVNPWTATTSQCKIGVTSHGTSAVCCAD